MPPFNQVQPLCAPPPPPAGLLHPDMAETIAIPALAASPARDFMAAEPSADFGDGQFDDSEYPFAQGVLNGAKCCSKCGATKTPQWREGPFGEPGGGRGAGPAPRRAPAPALALPPCT